MRALICQQQGSPVADNIRFGEMPDPPSPAAGEVTLRTLCSAFNHMDLWVGRGVPGLNLEYPRVSGCDACAEVVGVGAGVDKSLIGRRVILNAAIALAASVGPGDAPESTLAPEYELIGEHRSPGAHAELFNAPVGNLADVGDSDPIEAAAFGLCALTAWSMMVTKAELRHGSWVLITGIGGGVATSALAIAKHFGCRTIVTSRHQWKLDRAAVLGADEGILDTGEDWSRGVRTVTGKRGVDMAVDSVGQKTHLSCIKSLARGGAYVTPGCTTGPDAITDLARLFWNQLRMFGSTMGSNAEFREVAALFRSGALRPVVDQVFKPEDGVDAYRRLEAAEQFGKLVIDWR
jgi:NADPH:quinone reductase-like Zn-dependent oxidoreductase